jgi:16S rRNA (uracil1498-N3)-methyltransferase
MSLPVFYFEPGGDDIASGRVSLRGDDARHLTHSMRARAGDHLLVGDGLGTFYHATISAVLKSEVTTLVDGSAKVEREVPAITLYQAVSRPSSMDETVYRAAETGVETVCPVHLGTVHRGRGEDGR